MRRSLALLICGSGLSFAQNLVYPPPSDSEIEIRKSIEYTRGLPMDVYLPAKRDREAPLPVLVFMNAVSDTGMRSAPQYVQWSKAAAG